MNDSYLNDDYMKEDQPAPTPRRRPQVAAAVGLLLAGGLAGGILAATNSASATDTPAATSAASAPAPDRHGGQRDGESLLTGAKAATARAAALKAVPGGTVDRLETDADGAVYEAHMTKPDGTRVTVKFDKNLKVTATEDGMGGGGPGGGHGRSSSRTSTTSI